MGSVADKIAKKILSSRGSKVVDLAGWREGRKMALEAGFGDDGPALGKLAGRDPCHALYVVGQNVASLMAESISGMREAKSYVGIVGDAEDQYLPPADTPDPVPAQAWPARLNAPESDSIHEGNWVGRACLFGPRSAAWPSGRNRRIGSSASGTKPNLS